MFEDELRDILRDLVRSTRASGATIVPPQASAPSSSDSDADPEQAADEDAPLPPTVNGDHQVPLGRGAILQLHAPSQESDQVPAALERAARAVRSCARRWNQPHLPNTHCKTLEPSQPGSIIFFSSIAVTKTKKNAAAVDWMIETITKSFKKEDVTSVGVRNIRHHQKKSQDGRSRKLKKLKEAMLLVFRAGITLANDVDVLNCYWHHTCRPDCTLISLVGFFIRERRGIDLVVIN